MSIRLKNGELKTMAIKALVKAHNKAMDWDIKGLKRTELIKFIQNKGYKINHENNRLDLTGSAMKRRPAKIVPIKKSTAELKKEMEKKKKAKETRERNKKRKEAVAKVGAPPLPTKETLKKVQQKKKTKPAPAKKSVTMGTQTGQTTTTIGTRPKNAGRVDTSASAKGKVMKPERKKTKLKGKLTAAQRKQTDQLEKDFPEFYAEDINDRNNRMKFYVPILKEYRKIKQSGTPEQKKQAKKILDKAVDYRGTEASRFNGFTQSLQSIMKTKEKKISNLDKTNNALTKLNVTTITDYRNTIDKLRTVNGEKEVITDLKLKERRAIETYVKKVNEEIKKIDSSLSIAVKISKNNDNDVGQIGFQLSKLANKYIKGQIKK